MKLTNIIEKKPLLESIQYGMTPDQRRIVEGIVREFMPIYEATLTKDQIDQLFGTIEKDPSSRTAIGKGVDIAKKANEITNKLGKWIADTTPVKGADGKFQQLKDKIGAKFPELDKQLTGLGTWMKENPGKTAAIIGVLTSIAALAGGPVGSAIAGQVMRVSTGLIKGEKLSTAIGKGLKTAAVGWLAGYTMDKIGDAIEGIARTINPIPLDNARNFDVITMGSSKLGTMKNIDIYGTPKELEQFNSVFDSATAQWNRENYDTAWKLFQKAEAIAKAATENNELNLIKGIDPAKSAADLATFFDGLSAAAQGAATGATAMDKEGKPVKGDAKESVILQQRPLSEGQVYLVFQRLDEGPFDAIKKVAGKAAGAVGGAIAKGAQKVGTALTQKNTAQGLAKAWTKAGSPTDSDELYKFLLTQKINKDALDKIYGDMKFPVPQNVQEPEPEAEPDQGATDAGGTATAKAGDTEPEATGGDVTGAKPSTAKAGDAEPEDDTMKRAAGTPGAPDDFKQAAGATSGGGNVVQMPRQVDLNKLAQDIKAQGREVVQKVKVQLTKDLKSA